MPAAGRATFTSAHWMVDWIHGHAAHSRPLPEPPIAPSLPERLLVVSSVADDANGSPAARVNSANFSAWQLQGRATRFDGKKLCRNSGATNQLGAPPWVELDAMDWHRCRYH
jgi:hypothetical protein